MWQPSCDATSAETPASSSSPTKKAVTLPHLASDLQTTLRQMNVALAHFDIAVAFQRRHGLGNARLGYAEVLRNVDRAHDALTFRQNVDRFEIVFSGFT